MIALTLTKSISLPTTLVFSGLANILTGAIFGIPLPVQPMKAIAAVAISQNFTKQETAAAGLTVAFAVATLSITGLLRWFGRVVPVPVVKGIQVGAGLALVISAGTTLLQPLGWIKPSWADNWLWAMGAFALLVCATLFPRMPYTLVVFVFGMVMAGIQLSGADQHVGSGAHFWNPSTFIPAAADWRKGAVDAALPQLPLTTLNSILAVTSLSASLFPEYPPAPSLTSLGLSVALANLIGCWFGAMPVCHGSGGLAGQYRFGARSGASVIILGLVKLLLGLFAGEAIVPLLQRFPKSLLGIMVIAAGVELAKVGQSLNEGQDLWEEAEQENQDRPRKIRNVDEQEKRDRWAVMLVTVAGCLAFKNDAVGFIAGMIWHWALEVSRLVERRRGTQGQNWRQQHRQAEEAGLLNLNQDAPEGRVA